MSVRICQTTRTLLIVSGLLLALSWTLAQQPDFEEVLQTIDARSNFQGDLSATFTLVSTDPEEGNETNQVRFFRRDGEDKFLLLILKPETQLGQGYLNIEDGLWFYDPESRQFTYTSLSESFEDSDANNDDFGASSLAEDYDVVSSSEGTLGNFEVWILELEATNDEVTYPFQKIWVTQKDNLLLKSEGYSLTQRLLRTSFFPSYARVGDNIIPDRMIFVDALVADKMTEITITEITTAAIPDNVFTKAYVERVNR
ncbi:MAG: outer membrane lipoprotein-sorting protein [Trueperaceae bacterium]|nr:MAG: outer membrane lipoprotein-sorting protein [Trueperaceae bacterium]